MGNSDLYMPKSLMSTTFSTTADADYIELGERWGLNCNPLHDYYDVLKGLHLNEVR